MLLYISGSYPDNQEGIAAGAKVLLDAMTKVVGKQKIVLLTTDTPVISKHIETNSPVPYKLIKNWKVTRENISFIYNILDKYDITAIHMEYPGDLYGKTFLASFLPFFIKLYNFRKHKSVTFNVRLHEFSRARLLRKMAILPILWFSDSVYVPALKDRSITRKFAGNKVESTIIGTNIEVDSSKLCDDQKKTISYFGSVYSGKGIERMLKIWKEIHARDDKGIFQFKIIGDVGTEDTNHFRDYHKQVWKWIHEYGLEDILEVTGYISDEAVSQEIQHSAVATLFYEDGLTLRRGSFLAYLAHGIPIVTAEGDNEARRMFDGHKGVNMIKTDSEALESIEYFGEISFTERQKIHDDNIMLSQNFKWSNIAEKFLKDYGLL